ncbi:MAG: RidA family protein [Candidatus Rariloculaceae bacterium]|jgi:enamine deaminase RidA (YjgF/YER057c/UK114 family)|nr:RidA family protein [Gammaproteobacteria bacterium]|tara:strand:+ start:184 stop:591 length:408 start_codon:yes stop_codon:yes gene_type:complete
MMEIERINPKGLYKHPNFTRIITVKGPMKLIFIAGQTPSDENYNAVSIGDYRAQYIAVMENLEIQLEAAGAGWDDVVFQRIFVLDVDKFKNQTRGEDAPKFGDPNNPPPTTLIGVTALADPDFLIEVDLMAITDA